MNLPTAITCCRLFFSPCFFLIYQYYSFFSIPPLLVPYLLFFLLSLSELSDILDGYLARKYQQVTDLGKILDPMVDSVSRISLFLAFTLPPVSIPPIFILLFLYRDSTTATLRILSALKGKALHARWSGKIKAILQAATSFLIVLLLFPYYANILPQSSLQSISFILMSITVLFSLLSVLEYLYIHRTIFSSFLSKAGKKRRMNK